MPKLQTQKTNGKLNLTYLPPQNWQDFGKTAGKWITNTNQAVRF